MKFLVFSDLHGEKKAIREIIERGKKKEIDFLICGGDYTLFGQNARFILKQLNSVGKKCYIISGNHEEGIENLDMIMKEYPNCINFDRKAIKIGGYVFLGYGGGGFAMEDEEFRKIARKWYGKYNGEKIILVTHMAPYGNKLDLLTEEHHVGNHDYRSFVERIKPKLAISGHLHETVNEVDTIGETKLVNPGWDGMVIELK
jgi:uncharacterized protein